VNTHRLHPLARAAADLRRVRFLWDRRPALPGGADAAEPGRDAMADAPAHGFRADIEGLRALAIIPVVLFHVGLGGFTGGFVGVDVFFVISGFLITASLDNDIRRGVYSIANFYVRRIRRIFPAYVALICVVSLCAVALQLPADLKDYGTSMAATAVYVSNITFWQGSGDYFGVKSEFQPLLHTWSLAVEEQFYIVFPVLLALVARFGSRAWTLAAVGLCFVASLALGIYMTQTAPVASFFLLPSRAWELLAGSLLALGVAGAPRRAAVAEVAGACGLVLIVAPILLYSAATPFPGLAAVPPVLGAALILYAGMGERRTLVGRMLSHPGLRFFGLISYSLYLWHWPIIVFLRYVFLDLDLPLKLAVLPLSVAAATLSWRFVERPFRRPSTAATPRRLFLVTTAITCGIAATGLAFARDGLPWRASPQILRMADKATYQGPARTCGNAFRQRRTLPTLCVRGAPGAVPDLLVIGDSHADAFAQAVFDAAAQAGRAGYQISDTGYRLLPGYEKIGEEAKYRYLNQLALRLLDSHPEVRTIVVPMYWHQAVSVDGYRTASGARVAGATAVEAGVSGLLARYPGRRFLFVLPAAHSLAFGGSAAARAAWYGRTGFHPVVPRAAFEAEQAAYAPIVARLSHNARVSVLRMSDLLCDAALCHGDLAGGLAYSDDNHPSYAATERLRPAITRYLRR
jgi:peptidoglycan/LPS O-acetylase OafA/YrhL